MNNVINHSYIPEQILNFYDSPRCCEEFCGTFRKAEQFFISYYASTFGFRSKVYVHNGIEQVKVHKLHCTHFLNEEENLCVHPHSVKDLFLFHRSSGFIGTQKEMQMSPDFVSPGVKKPSASLAFFAQGQFKQSMPRDNICIQDRFYQDCKLTPYKRLILEEIKKNRVLVLSGDSSIEKVEAVSMFILEASTQSRRHCKVICIQNEQSMAAYNSERLAGYLDEKVGETIAFHVPLKSRISDASNVIYTTPTYMLRVLIGKNASDSFRHISHIIICNVHLQEAYTDILLHELRIALQLHEQLRVILLSNSQDNSRYLSYFEACKEINFDVIYKNPMGGGSGDSTRKLPKIVYVDQIRRLVEENRSNGTLRTIHTVPPNVTIDDSTNKMTIDRCLDEYGNYGTDQAFEDFMYLVRSEYISVNSRHSISGDTAAIIAAKLGNINHLLTLLNHHADPLISNEDNINAVLFALTSKNDNLVNLLNCYFNTGSQTQDSKIDFIDYRLITDLISIILTSKDWEQGDILVLLPTYQDLIHLNYAIVRCKLIGDLPQEISINLLYHGIEKDLLELALAPISAGIKIILATDVVDSIAMASTISYVIDSARTNRPKYNTESRCKENINQWVSQKNLDSHAALINCEISKCGGLCFRLIPNVLFKQLPHIHVPELLTMPLDRVCLTVKLLSPATMIAEYLQRTIVRPPFKAIYQTVEFLKKIDAIDELEDITWLGCRLIDIPIDCQLGKLIVFGILLQCFDPVLTIVSFLSNFDPLEVCSYTDTVELKYLDVVRRNVKKERVRLTEGITSDLLIYVRLFQEWQDMTRSDTEQYSILMDEYSFVFNGLLEKVANTRMNLVCLLRSCQLLHNQGYLNMHHVNSSSNNWPLIKGALAGALYPNICAIDKTSFQIVSNEKKKLIIHPNSILRPIDEESTNFSSPWIVYSKMYDRGIYNNIDLCTIVSPLVVAFFMGPPKMCSSNLSQCRWETVSAGDEADSQPSTRSIKWSLDNWLEFTMDAEAALLLFKTRQYFYKIYLSFLQNCDNTDKDQNDVISLSQIPDLMGTIDKVVMREDIILKLPQPATVGGRPKAIHCRILSSLNSISKPANESQLFCMIDGRWELPDKQFFLVICRETIMQYNYQPERVKAALDKLIGKTQVANRLMFIIEFSKCPVEFHSVGIIKWQNTDWKLEECFRDTVPIRDLIGACLKHNIQLPSFDKYFAFEIDKKVGRVILDLFAYRNKWLYND